MATKKRKRRRAAPISEDGIPGIYTGEAHRRHMAAWRIYEETGDFDIFYNLGVHERPDPEDDPA